MLLHRVKWQLKETFSALCDHYVRNLLRNYGSNGKVIFDGYEVSTKDAERSIRASTNASADIIFDENMQLRTAQEKFLANSSNKNRFIKLLIKKLSDHKIDSKQHSGDADRLIVETALEIDGNNIAVVSEDIDVLVLLTALTPKNREIYFLKPSRGKTQQQIFSSSTSMKCFPNCKENILFLHAFTGCDTTSTFYNRGKKAFMTVFENRPDVQKAAEEFKKKDQDIDVLFKAGVKCILALYGAAKAITDLHAARYHFFVKSSTKKSAINLSSLPPTDDAALHHIKRVYCQVQQWIGNDILPELWGWKLDKTLVPIMSEEPPAPEKLLKMIFCSCKKKEEACKGCTCKKAGLYCTAACTGCSGISCTNVEEVNLTVAEDLDEENELI